MGEKLQADQELGNEADKFADRQRDCVLRKVQWLKFDQLYFCDFMSATS